MLPDSRFTQPLEPDCLSSKLVEKYYGIMTGQPFVAKQALSLLPCNHRSRVSSGPPASCLQDIPVCSAVPCVRMIFVQLSVCGSKLASLARPTNLIVVNAERAITAGNEMRIDVFDVSAKEVECCTMQLQTEYLKGGMCG